jgi:hypothetical protein
MKFARFICQQPLELSVSLSLSRRDRLDGLVASAGGYFSNTTMSREINACTHYSVT